MKQYILQCLLFLLSVPVYSLTQQQNRFTNMSLPGAKVVFDFAQDHNGLLWLATDNYGLYSYDGYHCLPAVSANPADNLSSLSMCIVGDSIFLGHEKRVSVYNILTHAYSYPQQPYTTSVRAFLRMGDNLYYGADQGLFCHNIKSGRTRLITSVATNIYSLALSGKGILIGSLYGLYVLRGNKCRSINNGMVSKKLVNAICQDFKDKNSFWIGCIDGLYKYNIVTGDCYMIGETEGKSVKTLSPGKRGILYVGTDNGLFTIDGQSISQDVHDSQSAYSVSNNIIWKTFVDKDENLFLGTDYGFSFSLSDRTFKYLPVFQMTGVKSGNYLQCLFEDSHHNFWIGGTSGLILRKASGKVIWYRQEDMSHPITHNRIRSFYEDRDGNVWIMTDGGIQLYDPLTDRLRNFVVADSRGHFSALWAYGMTEDDMGRLWVASYNGLYIVSRKRLLSSKTSVVRADHIMMPKLHFSQILKDGNGNLWSSDNDGIKHIDAKTLKVTNKGKGGTFSLCQTPEGDVWAASEREILHFSADGVKAGEQKYSSGSSEVLGMDCIGNQIWILSLDLCRVIVDGKHVDAFRIPMQDATAGYYSPVSHLYYIGGNDGLYIVDPKAMARKGKGSSFMLTSVTVNGSQTDLGIVAKEGETLRLKHNENNITLRFTDFPFSGHRQNIYAYMLEGVDNDWIPLDESRYDISYNGLPHGSYRLSIRVIDGLGKVGEEVLSLKLRILPPWYLTWWMKLIYILVLSGIIAGLTHLYGVRKRLRQEHEARTQILDEMKGRAAFYDKLYGQLKHSLSMLMMPLGRLLSDGGGEEGGALLTDMRHASTRLVSLIRQVTDQDTASAKGELNTLEAVSFCNQVVDEMEEKAKEKGASLVFSASVKEAYFTFDITEAVFSWVVLLSFAIQYCRKGGKITVSLGTSAEGDKIVTSVSSDDISIPGNIRTYLFQKYALQYLSADNPASKMYLVHDAITGYGGSIDVAANGITVSLPAKHIRKSDAESKSAISPAVSHPKNHVKSESDIRLLKEAMTVIGENIDNSDFNVARLQEALGVGDKMLYRKIKQLTGLTPVEYIRDTRLKRAAALLGEGRYTVSEVMYMAGFSNRGYFSKCFTNAYGMSPSEYQQRANSH